MTTSLGETVGTPLGFAVTANPVTITQIDPSSAQRVVLIAEEFDYEVLVTAEWLYAKNVEIDCVRVELAVDGEAEYFTFSQVFPAPQLAEQARKRGRESAPPIDASWDEALASVENEAVAEFFRSHLKSGVSERLKYRSVEFPPENRIKVYLHRTYASALQWCGRFPGDIAFWRSRVNPPKGIQEWSKAHPNDCLRFRLTTAEEFAAFERALVDSELKRAKWSNAATEATDATTRKAAISKFDSKQYAALIIAARRLGYSSDDFESAMARFGKNGEEFLSEQAKVMRFQIEQEAARVLAESSAEEIEP